MHSFPGYFFVALSLVVLPRVGFFCVVARSYSFLHKLIRLVSVEGYGLPRRSKHFVIPGVGLLVARPVLCPPINQRKRDFTVSTKIQLFVSDGNLQGEFQFQQTMFVHCIMRMFALF